MNIGTWMSLVGGVIGLGVALFGVTVLVTGRAPASTSRSFRNVRDTGFYFLLFGLGLVLLAAGTQLPGDLSPAASAVVAIVLVGVAVVRYRPRGKKET